MTKESEVRWPMVKCEECFAVHNGEEAMKSPMTFEMINAMGLRIPHQHINWDNGEVKWYCSHECCDAETCVPLDHPKASQYRKDTAGEGVKADG